MLPDKKEPKGFYSIISQVKKDFPEVDPRDVDRIILAFWDTKSGIQKYFRGYESFSVNNMFFFLVAKSKITKMIEKKRISSNKRNSKYMKKVRRKRGLKRPGRKPTKYLSY